MTDGQVRHQADETFEPTGTAADEVAFEARLGGNAGAEEETGFSEAEVEHLAEILRARVTGAKRAAQAYNMAAWFAMNAAARIRYGVYSPAMLAEALRETNLWVEQGAEALLALGDVIEMPGTIPAPAILQADLAATRVQARDCLNALAACAASHAHLLDVAPDNIPALMAIGRSVTEAWHAADHALIGMGATIATIETARAQSVGSGAV